jgi:hypothetical protein
MSASEILIELPRLTPAELELIQERILELEEARIIEPSPGLNAAIAAGLSSLENEPTVTLDEARPKVRQWAGRSF